MWVFQQFIFLLSLWEKRTFCTWMISRSSLCHFNERQLGLLIRPIKLPYIYIYIYVFFSFFTHACIFKASRTQICLWSVRCCVLISVYIDLSLCICSKQTMTGWLERLRLVLWYTNPTMILGFWKVWFISKEQSSARVGNRKEKLLFARLRGKRK